MDAREAAAQYIELGWYPIPLNPGTKECRDSGWKGKVYTPDDFQPGDNVGIRLVNSSDKLREVKLVAVDLDAPEAVEVYHHFLPKSTAIWGRDSKLVSQVLYVSTFERAISYKDLETGKTIIELRVDHQSMAPPSIHPSGERVKWLEGNGPIHAPVVSAEDLLLAVRLVATAATIKRYYPPPGTRHDWGLALAGFLRSLGVKESMAKALVQAAAEAAGDQKLKDRTIEVTTTYARTESDPTVGSARLAELIGGDRGHHFIATIRKIWGIATTFSAGKGGKPNPNNEENIRQALSTLGVHLFLNVFTQQMMIQINNGTEQQLDDGIMDRLWLQMERQFRFRPSRDYFDTVLRVLARETERHPVREYLDSLKWDGKERIPGWLSHYGGAAQTDFTVAVGTIVLVAAVRRVRQPGVKFDEILVLESPQGRGKSTMLRYLCPNDDWFSDDLPLGVDSKQTIERTTGRWIIEAQEMVNLRKTQAEQLKAFLSRQVDGPVRMAYARVAVSVPRSFIIVGTTNAHTYLRDSTGNRRFWSVRMDHFRLNAIRNDRDQLWAEAAALEASGASIRLPESLWDIAALQQERRYVQDAWEEPIQDFLDNVPRDNKGRQRIEPEAVWEALKIPMAQRDDRAAHRLALIMQKLGFRRMTIRTAAEGAEGTRVRKGWGRDGSVLLGSPAQTSDES